VVSDVGRSLSLAAIACAVGLLAAAFFAAVAAANEASRLRGVARGIGFAAAAPLLALLGRGPAQPFIAFVVAAALAGPQPVALALAAGAAVLAAIAPTTGIGSIALLLGGAAGGIAAHTLGRSAAAHIAAGRDAARPALAVAVAACALVLWRPEGGVLVHLVFVASLAAALLLGASAWSGDAQRSPRPRRFARGALFVAAGMAVIAAGAALRASASVTGVPTTTSPAPGALVAMAGLLAVAAVPLARAGAHGDPLEEEQAGTVLSRLVVVLALLATLAAGGEGWMRAGTYMTPLARRFLAAALVAFAASETPVWRGAARALALFALLLALLG
jgi:hypothetical protein